MAVSIIDAQFQDLYAYPKREIGEEENEEAEKTEEENEEAEETEEENEEDEEDDGMTIRKLGWNWWSMYHEYLPFRSYGEQYRELIRSAYYDGYLDQLSTTWVLMGDFQNMVEKFLNNELE